MTKRILAVGGGTAGHIYPILAVFSELGRAVPEGDLELHYVGERKDVESELIQKYGQPIQKHIISAGKINRFLTWKHFLQAGRFIKGYAQAERLLSKVKPALIFAKGGYVCAPVILAARRRSIPVFAHETDLIPGVTNRMISRSAVKVFTTFPKEHYHAGSEVHPQGFRPAGC